MTCDECGFESLPNGDRCTERWHLLLALDHSHERPWGPLHGLAFATWTLQHPRSADPRSVERAWGVMDALFVRQIPPPTLFQSMRDARGNLLPGWNAPALPATAPKHFSMTIAALGDFDAAQYEANVWAWARATFDAWRHAA